MAVSTGLCQSLGALLTQYLNGQRTFEELETWIAGVACASSEDRELLKRVYHVLNHFDIDESLRKKDANYAVMTSEKLRSIAASLTAASIPQIKKSIDAFWNPK